MAVKKMLVVIDQDDKIVHSTTDPFHFEFLQRHVRQAIEAGDDWHLYEFTMTREIPCDPE